MTTIRIGSKIVARIGDERLEGNVENIEITTNSDSRKYGDPADSVTIGTEDFVCDIPGRFIYSYQIQYVDGVWVGDKTGA